MNDILVKKSFNERIFGKEVHSMQNSNIAFANLRAEMSRRNIGVVEMARRLGWNRDTLARKLSGRSSINLDEAFLIQRTCFPSMDVKYPFAEADQKGA